MPLSANPGDLIFFAGSACVPSRLIAAATCTPAQLLRGEWISHVGIVFAHQGRLLLAESTTLSESPCVLAGRCVKGVQAHPLADAIAAYPGKAWIGRLGHWNRLSEAESRKLTDMVLSLAEAPYDELGAVLAGTHWLKRLIVSEQAGRFFCSELCAWLLKHLGRWDWKAAGRYTPAGMARGGVRTGRIGQLEGVK
jgi:hypothetical protein